MITVNCIDYAALEAHLMGLIDFEGLDYDNLPADPVRAARACFEREYLCAGLRPLFRMRTAEVITDYMQGLPSWFNGPYMTADIAALLYSMGAEGDPEHLDRLYWHHLGRMLARAWYDR